MTPAKTMGEEIAGAVVVDKLEHGVELRRVKLHSIAAVRDPAKPIIGKASGALPH